MTDHITARQFHEADGTEDWRVVGDGACAYFRTGSFEAGTRLVHAIGGVVDIERGHPDIDLRRDSVTVRLITITEDYYGLVERHVELARRISAAARDLNIPADISGVQSVQVTIDALANRDVI